MTGEPNRELEEQRIWQGIRFRFPGHKCWPPVSKEPTSGESKEHTNPDFVKLAEAFGAAGYIIEEPDRIAPVLKEAMNCGKLAIVDARIDPEDPAPANIEAILKMRGLAG